MNEAAESPEKTTDETPPAPAVTGLDPLQLAGSLLLSVHNTLATREAAASVDRRIALGGALATFALADATRRLHETLAAPVQQVQVQHNPSGIVVPMVAPGRPR